MLPWSVIPRAGWPSATAASTRSLTRAAPSSIENSVWVWRWVNDRAANVSACPSRIGRPGPVEDAARAIHRLWTSYSGVIPTIARTELGWLGGPLTWDAARRQATGRGRDVVRAVGDTFVVHLDREALND